MTFSDYDLLDMATAFQFAPRLTVEARGDGHNDWAVVSLGSCWDVEANGFVCEPLPSSRTDAFRKHTRFSRNKALEIAQWLIESAPEEIRRGFYVYESEIPPRKTP